MGSFIEYHNVSSPESVTQEQISSFYKWLHERPNKRLGGGLSDNYIYQHVYALKLFFRYQEETGEITYNPISAMKFKRPEYAGREPLSREEIRLLFDTAETMKETAILHLFYSCGLRRSEAQDLHSKDLCFAEKLLYVRKGKGKGAKRRAVPLAQKAAEQLQQYLNRERGNADTESFILNKNGKPMSGNSFYNTVRNLTERSGINKTVTLHQLRHSIASHLLERGLSVESVRNFLGHRHLESTQAIPSNTLQYKRTAYASMAVCNGWGTLFALTNKNKTNHQSQVHITLGTHANGTIYPAKTTCSFLLFEQHKGNSLLTARNDQIYSLAGQSSVPLPNSVIEKNGIDEKAQLLHCGYLACIWHAIAELHYRHTTQHLATDRTKRHAPAPTHS